MDVAQWWEYANSILPKSNSGGYDVPDSAYDSLREQYYYRQMAPDIAKRGFSPAASKETFMKATARPGKSDYPRAELVGKGIVAGLTAPVMGLAGKGKESKALVQEAEHEAARQGMGPLQTGALSMVGQGIGMAPYFAGPTAGARAIGTALAGPLGQAALEIPVVGAIQGLYDAASADDGHRVEAGAEGFMMGAAFAGAFEGAATLKRTLQQKHGLTAGEADAVTNAMKGTADDAQEVIAQNVVTNIPAVGDTIEQEVVKKKRVSKRAGQPKNPPTVTENAPATVVVATAEGQPYTLTGITKENVEQIAPKIDQHLQAGGEIVDVGGSQENIQALYKSIEDKMEVELPVQVGGQEVKVRTRAREKKVKPTPTVEAAPPTPAAPTAPAESTGDLTSLLTQSIDKVKKERKPKAAPVTPHTGFLGSELHRNLQILGDGSFVNKVDGMKFPDLPTALDHYGVKYELGPGVARRPMAGSIMEDGYFYEPSGKRIDAPDHDLAARDYLTANFKPGEVDLNNPIQEMLDRGIVRRKGDALQFDESALTKDGVSIAVMDVFGSGKKAVMLDVFPVTPPGGLAMPRSMMEDFINNPRKVLMQLKSDYKKGIKYELGTGEAVAFNYADAIKERALAMTAKGSIGDAKGATMSMGKGNKPLIIYGDDADRGTVFHENLHGHFAYLGIDKQIQNDLEQLTHTRVLANALGPDARRLAGDSINEEVATYLTTAVRTNDSQMLQRFVDADDNLPTVLETASRMAGMIKGRALQLEPSLSQRVLVRRMDAVQRRAGVITDLEHTATMMGKDLSVRDGKFVLSDAATSQTFSSREALINHMDEKWSEPLNSPVLLNDSMFPDSLPKFEVKRPNNPPISTQPPPSSLPPEGKVKGGIQSFSFFLRPFHAWLDTVARKNQWPELAQTFRFDTALVAQDKYVEGGMNKLRGLLKDTSADKAKGIYHYMENPTDAVAQRFNLSPKDVATAKSVLEHSVTPTLNEMGLTPDHYFEYMRQMRAGGKVTPNKVLPKEKLTLMEDALTDIDMRDTDIGRVTYGLMRNSGRMRYVEPYLQSAEAIVNAKAEDGSWVLGSLRPMFKRHVQFMRNRPDQSQMLMEQVAGATIESINDMIGGMNKKLPAGRQMPKIESSARDALGRMMLFQYAGTMGMRPMAWVRDGMQVITTTLPMLGPKYFSVGMNKAFGTVPKGRASEAFLTAKQYGAMMEHHDLQNLYASGGETMVDGKVTRVAEWMLKPMQFANNSNRLVAFWGHSERALDAIKQHRADPKAFAKESGLIYLDKTLQDAYLKELATTSTMQQWRDMSFRMGKDLTDVSQWNYRKGAHPGIYKYAMGRLLGQYGTWPLNYVEYGRRLLASGDMYDRAKAATYFGLAHGGILKAGEATGIDTASWVFTSPASFQGGPPLTAAQSVLTALDTQSRKGDEARRNLARQAEITLPGGLAMEQVYNAIREDSPDTWKILLGFNPLDEADMKRGLHDLP